MKVLITGANGFVGTHLIQELLKSNHQVFALIRNPESFKKEFSHQNLFIIQGDLSAPTLSWVQDLPPDLDTCIHTAGIVHSYNTDHFFNVNSIGTAHLINSLKNKFQHLHFILISSLAAAGPSLGPQKRTEDDLDLPISLYGRSKKEAEIKLRELAPSAWITSIIRPPMVIGPRDAAVLDIFKMVKGGLVLLPGIKAKKKLYSFVCVFDLVATIVKVSEQKKSLIIYSAHPEEITFHQLILEIKKNLKKKWLFYIPVPLFILKLIAHALFFIYKLSPHPLRLTPDKYFELSADNWTCDSSKSENDLGIVYKYNLTRTIQMTKDDYKGRGWI